MLDAVHVCLVVAQAQNFSMQRQLMTSPTIASFLPSETVANSWILLLSFTVQPTVLSIGGKTAK